MNWLLLATAAALILFACMGYRKGMLRILFSFGSLLIAILISYIVTPYATNFIKTHTSIYETVREQAGSFVEETVLDALTDLQTEGVEGADAILQQAVSQDTEAVEGELAAAFAENLQLPEALTAQFEGLLSEVELSAQSTVSQIETDIGGLIADMVISAIAFVITLIVTRLILWIVYRVLDLVSRLPVVHGINQVFGLVIGLAEGLLAVWICFIFLTCIMHTQFGMQCLRMIAQSTVLTALYSCNPLLYLL